MAARELDDSGFAPVPRMDRRSSGDLVAVHIRSLIFNGELRQGDRVRQDEIARRLGVSRIPVREAIIALDREGWLEITPHRGAFVHGLDEDSLRDHYELLGLVYGLAGCPVSTGDLCVPTAAEGGIACVGAFSSENWLVGLPHERQNRCPPKISAPQFSQCIDDVLTSLAPVFEISGLSCPGDRFAESDTRNKKQVNQREAVRAVDPDPGCQSPCSVHQTNVRPHPAHSLFQPSPPSTHQPYRPSP